MENNIEVEEYKKVSYLTNSEENVGVGQEGVSLFAVHLTVFIRAFKGQTSGKSIGTWEFGISLMSSDQPYGKK